MTTQRVEFDASNGSRAPGELAVPAGSGRAPGVVLIQEWWGLNDHIRSLLERLAEAGFVALAPDLFHGKTTRDAGEAGKLMGALDWGVAMAEVAGAERFLAAHERSNGNVGVMGFCMGGAVSFAAATRVPGFKAVVPFYGLRSADEDWSKVTAPIQAHFAARDDWAKPEGARAVEQKLAALGKKMELHVYDADHAFVNDTRPEVYAPDAAKLAWSRAMGFLHANLD
jgi:carboxymethylenebutenolidase